MLPNATNARLAEVEYCFAQHGITPAIWQRAPSNYLDKAATLEQPNLNCAEVSRSGRGLDHFDRLTLHSPDTTA